jgi:hypothetical protein
VISDVGLLWDALLTKPDISIKVSFGRETDPKRKSPPKLVGFTYSELVTISLHFV